MATAVADAAVLPQRLMSFFAKYPPSQFSAKHTGITITLTKKESAIAARKAKAESLASIPDSPTNTDTNISQPEVAPTPLNPSRAVGFPPNPFLPLFNKRSGRWRGSKISLRTQAELVKMARKHGVETLLPPGRKSTAFKQYRSIDRGLRIRGTGEDQRVKGHKWERKQATTLEMREKAMEGMPELIREWEQRGHGRGWKKFPK